MDKTRELAPDRKSRHASIEEKAQRCPKDDNTMRHVDTPRISPVFAGDTSEVITRMRVGVPARALRGIAASFGIDEHSLFAYLGLPRGTIARRVRTGGSFRPSNRTDSIGLENCWIERCRCWKMKRPRTVGSHGRAGRSVGNHPLRCSTLGSASSLASRRWTGSPVVACPDDTPSSVVDG